MSSGDGTSDREGLVMFITGKRATFVLWPHEEDELETFHRHLNSQHPSIQFTMEKESEGKISFLDVQIMTKEGKLSTGVDRKNTHTDRYINYSSHHHPRIKTEVTAYLKSRESL